MNRTSNNNAGSSSSSSSQHLLASNNNNNNNNNTTMTGENNEETINRPIMKEMCQFAPLIVLAWLFIGCIGLGSTIAVQPVFFQRSFAAHYANVKYEDIICPVTTKDPNCIKGLNLAGTYNTYMSGIASFLTLILSPWMGSVADRVGKRPMLILASFIQIPSCLFVLLAIYYPGNLNYIYAYYAASVLNGSWFVAVILGAFADFCSPVNRAAGFALVLATFELSFVLGPEIGQISYHFYGLKAPYILQLGCISFRCILIFFLPKTSLQTKEELETSRRSSFASMTSSRDGGSKLLGSTGGSTYNMSNVIDDAAASNNITIDGNYENFNDNVENDNKKNCFQVFYQDICSSISILNRSPLFRILTVIALVQAGTQNGIQVLFSYVTRSGFHFKPADVANLLLIIMSSSFVIQVGFTKPLLKCIKERGMLAVGLGAGVVNMFLSGLVLYYFEHGLISIATSKLYVYLISGCISSLGFFAFPALSAIKANNVAAHEQSATQGALYSARSIAGGITPFIYGSLYHHYTKHPEYIYFVTALLNIIPLVCLFYLPKETWIEKQNKSMSNAKDTIEKRNDSGGGGGGYDAI